MICRPLYTNEIGYIASVGDTFVYAGKGSDGKNVCRVFVYSGGFHEV